MPAWGTHLATANRILENLQIEKYSFLFGNILPDVNNGYIIKNISCLKTYEETHYFKQYNFEGQKEYLPDIQSFFHDYKEKINNPIILGYFVHLLTDYYWNKEFYLKYGILNNEKERIGLMTNTQEKNFCNREEARKIKVNDFNLFSKTLYQENKIELPRIEEELLINIEEIKCVQIIKEDLKKIKEYLNGEEKRNKEEKIIENYQIYTKEKIYEQFENSIFFILESLKKLKN